MAINVTDARTHSCAAPTLPGMTIIPKQFVSMYEAFPRYHRENMLFLEKKSRSCREHHKLLWMMEETLNAAFEMEKLANIERASPFAQWSWTVFKLLVYLSTDNTNANACLLALRVNSRSICEVGTASLYAC